MISKAKTVMDKSAEARKNMVKCQLHTNGVRDETLLDVFGAVPRERFLPADKQALAYIDEDVRLGDDGAFLLEPLIHARMVQALAPGRNDNVLNIGDYTGYSSAVLSPLVSTVVTLESKPGTLDPARTVWEDMEYCNVAIVRGQMRDGAPDHAPYNLIFINGAVPEIPESLQKQLAPEGRMVAVLKEPGKGIGQIVLVKRAGQGDHFARSVLYDAATFYVPEFEPEEAFSL